MKDQLRLILLTAALVLPLGSPAQAQTSGGVGYVGLPNSGVIHFFGRVRDVACTATVNGQGPTGYVILPDALVSNFPTVGSTFGSTPFYIELADCPLRSRTDPQIMAWPYFFAGHANAATGRLNNIPGIGQAIGIDLELATDKQDAFRVYQGATPFGNQGPVAGVATDTGTAKIDYTVRYYRAGAITPGAVRSNVDYIVYFQ